MSDAYTAICLDVFQQFCDRHKQTGECWKHKAPIRNCGCDPGVFLDVDKAQERDLRRAKAYGRLLRMRQNKVFWDWLAAP